MTVIRDAGPEDAETLQKIYDWYVRNTAVTFEYETPTAAQFRERMERTMERYPYLIAETDGRADGYCYAGPFVGRAAYDWSCELSIYLRPDVRRNGIGRMLYGEMEKRLRAMGIRNLYACIGVPRGEDAYLTRDSERFHKRMGFTTVGTFRACGAKFGRWYDMIWMEKMVGSHSPEPEPVRWAPEISDQK